MLPKADLVSKHFFNLTFTSLSERKCLFLDLMWTSVLVAGASEQLWIVFLLLSTMILDSHVYSLVRKLTISYMSGVVVNTVTSQLPNSIPRMGMGTFLCRIVLHVLHVWVGSLQLPPTFHRDSLYESLDGLQPPWDPEQEKQFQEMDRWFSNDQINRYYPANILMINYSFQWFF